MYISMQARPTHHVAYDALDASAPMPSQSAARTHDAVKQPAPGYERAVSAT